MYLGLFYHLKKIEVKFIRHKLSLFKNLEHSLLDYPLCNILKRTNNEKNDFHFGDFKCLAFC